MATEESDFEHRFFFNPLPGKKFSFLQDKETLALLMKWSMLGRISAQAFTFDHTFHSYNCEKFALDFFKDPSVISTLKNMDSGMWMSLGDPVVSVGVDPVPCTKVSMEMFDPIYSCGILRPSGHVMKCLHDHYGDFDELRQMLLEESSQHYDVIRKEEREEFLFRLFKHLCLGGEFCQYEDNVDPYMKTTKQMYKDLISVQKDPETKKISTVSTVLRVFAYDQCGRCFPETQDQDQTFVYMIVDPLKRHVTLFHHFYGIGDFTV